MKIGHISPFMLKSPAFAGPLMTDTLATSIKIDIVADLTCPWCYIGKHQLEAAIASYAGLDVDLHWRPFQLDPNIPEDGIDLSTYRTKKQNEHEAQANRAAASQAARDIGLAFAFDKIKRLPNTRDAHRLIRHALLYGAQTKLVERLFTAYFCEGTDIGNRRRLIELGEDCGIDASSSENLFAQRDDLFSIEEELAKTRAFNLPKIPFFVFADEIVVPGAASADIFTAALFRAQAAGPGSGTPLA